MFILYNSWTLSRELDLAKFWVSDLRPLVELKLIVLHAWKNVHLSNCQVREKRNNYRESEHKTPGAIRWMIRYSILISISPTSCAISPTHIHEVHYMSFLWEILPKAIAWAYCFMVYRFILSSVQSLLALVWLATHIIQKVMNMFTVEIKTDGGVGEQVSTKYRKKTKT